MPVPTNVRLPLLPAGLLIGDIIFKCANCLLKQGNRLFLALSKILARFLRALYREAGIAGASSHSGRRTLITRLAERGVDLKAIAQIAGHTSIRTTAMYVEANPTRLARILQDVTF